MVADDQTLVRTGFRTILTADGTDVVAEATNGVEAVDAVRRTRPDVVLSLLARGLSNSELAGRLHL